MKETLEYIYEDIKRYIPFNGEKKIGTALILKTILRNEPLWMIILYRLGRWLYRVKRTRLLVLILRIPYAGITRFLEILLGINIHLSANIGKGFYIGHCGSVWIGPVKIGYHCNISQEVTIGVGGRMDRGYPEIGDRVYIAPGAKLFGKIKVGNDAAIGANAVVSKSIPERAVVVGNPGRIVSHMGSGEFIHNAEEVAVQELQGVRK